MHELVVSQLGVGVSDLELIVDGTVLLLEVLYVLVFLLDVCSGGFTIAVEDNAFHRGLGSVLFAVSS